MSQSVRLFVAVQVPADVRGVVEERLEPVRGRFDGLRWIPPDAWHLTVCFLGHVAPAVGDAVAAGLPAAVAGVGPVAATLGAAGRGGRGGVLWLEVASEGLVALAARVRRLATDCGIAVEDRPFRGHLTLARARGRDRVPTGAVDAVTGADLPALTWTATAVELMRSHLGGGRPARYEALATVPLEA